MIFKKNIKDQHIHKRAMDYDALYNWWMYFQMSMTNMKIRAVRILHVSESLGDVIT